MNLTASDLRWLTRDRTPAVTHRKRSKRTPWTTTEDATLRQMADTHTSLQIARALDRTEHAVRARAVILAVVLPWVWGGRWVQPSGLVQDRRTPAMGPVMPG